MQPHAHATCRIDREAEWHVLRGRTAQQRFGTRAREHLAIQEQFDTHVKVGAQPQHKPGVLARPSVLAHPRTPARWVGPLLASTAAAAAARIGCSGLRPQLTERRRRGRAVHDAQPFRIAAGAEQQLRTQGKVAQGGMRLGGDYPRRSARERATEAREHEGAALEERRTEQLERGWLRRRRQPAERRARRAQPEIEPELRLVPPRGRSRGREAHEGAWREERRAGERAL